MPHNLFSTSTHLLFTRGLKKIPSCCSTILRICLDKHALNSASIVVLEDLDRTDSRHSMENVFRSQMEIASLIVCFHSVSDSIKLRSSNVSLH